MSRNAAAREPLATTRKRLRRKARARARAKAERERVFREEVLLNGRLERSSWSGRWRRSLERAVRRRGMGRA